MLHPGKYSISPDPYEFLQAFQEALCIITNSFHGTVFALIMRKPFITILQKGETAVQNTRIFSLLESLGLEDRIYHPEKAPWPNNWTVPLTGRPSNGTGRLCAFIPWSS